MLADHRGELEPVQFRHADVDQNDGNLVLQEILERFPPGGSDHQIFAKLLENNLIGEQLGRLVIDQKDVYLFMVHHRARRSAM
jgi:hypothetical protein